MAGKKKKQESRTDFSANIGLALSQNAARVLHQRYLLKDDHGRVIETPEQMFRRVAKSIASVEASYGKDSQHYEEEFYRMMASSEFLPNSPTLMNAGTRMGQLSACFVLPVEDSIEGIFDALKNMALVHQSGGGTGFSFSRLRPEGSIIGSTKCETSGPISFMKIFDSATDVIKQGGRRRGANIGIMRVDHPDVLKFISAKRDKKSFQNFNLSVAVTDSFMEAAEKGKAYHLVNPLTNEPTAKLNAKDVLRQMATNAWETGDPGVIFIDEINRHNPTPSAGAIESTNPCAEQPLLPYESCNLGSINLSKFVTDGRIDLDRMESAVRLAVRFLDDVIDANKFPLTAVEEMTKANRKIGLGVMGFADMLTKLGVPYDSEKAEELAEKLMKTINDKAREASAELARERGSFPNFKKSALADKMLCMRNASVTTVAPTGSISIIAGCSSGIEPLFGVCFKRTILEGTEMLEANTEFEKVAKEKGFYSSKLMKEIAAKGSVKQVKGVPDEVKKTFVTALDIAPEWHIRIQAAFQKHTDSGVSKTINFPAKATAADVEKAYKLAHKMKCKGITVYRYGSREGQVLTFSPEYSGGCPKECSF